MKTKILIIFLICFLSTQFVKAQSLIDCGITYYYDAGGNRILRMYVPCRVVKEDKTQDSTQTANNAKGLFTDSSTLASHSCSAMPSNIVCSRGYATQKGLHFINAKIGI
jgi:hypothetical protein